MQVEAVFDIKFYIDSDSLQTNSQHSILFIHFSEEMITTVVASKSKDAIYGMKVLNVKGNLFRKDLFEIKTMLNALEIEAYEYSNIKLIIENNCHSLIPEALFVSEKADSFLKLNIPLTKQKRVLFNRIHKNKVSVFAIPDHFYLSLKGVFPQAEIIHETELLLLVISSTSQKEHKDQLYVHLHDKYIEIAYLKDPDDLHYLNTFQVDADTDIIYFILSVAELLKLNQDKLQVNILGNISESNSLISLMKKYIPHVEFLKRPDYYSYPASFREFQDQQHYLQICSLLCAS